MQLLCLMLLLSMVSLASAAVDIELSANPSLPPTSVVVNGDMEAGDGPYPEGWSFSTARPDNFELRWERGGHSGERSLYLRAKSEVMSGYWNQTVPVVPGTRYAFGGFYRMSGGRLLFYAHQTYTLEGVPRGVDVRTYVGSARGHWLVPVFIPPEALTDPDIETWLPFETEVDIPQGLETITLSLGAYFSPGEAWFDDIYFTPLTTDLQITVRAQDTHPIAVEVRGAGGEVVFATEPDAELPADFSVTVEDLPADDVYTVTVKTADGQTVTKRYPDDGDAR